ncbi:hypothetical protein GPECTOR_1g326 [Gonium pectorale]|uniref:Uncharacterized protein n=1 Tax=Gonium pectorale TaxID=33097 RepID=A0A150H3E7_GONPE|nr:hypothetical protein GPECTOR_1g326 [Gonium pectorale]|eukprot:KXZ56368.1 hypothetical protein GPECTOR_1g326 [Gonium pectorale]
MLISPQPPPLSLIDSSPVHAGSGASGPIVVAAPGGGGTSSAYPFQSPPSLAARARGSLTGCGPAGPLPLQLQQPVVAAASGSNPKERCLAALATVTSGDGGRPHPGGRASPKQLPLRTTKWADGHAEVWREVFDD